MANPISKEVVTGTIGELLVQLRLLQYNIQAAPPLKDSGNDLVALKGKQVKLIQVKTTINGRFPRLPSNSKIFDLLAIVVLEGHDQILCLDDSVIYLIPKNELKKIPRRFDQMGDYVLEGVADKLFSDVPINSVKQNGM